MCTRVSIQEDWGLLTRLVRTYTKNTEIHADKNSIGLMCFKTRKLAEKWLNVIDLHIREGLQIIRVKTTSRGKTPESIYPIWVREYSYSDYDDFMSTPKDPIIWEKPPEGTICYMSLIPLD